MIESSGDRADFDAETPISDHKTPGQSLWMSQLLAVSAPTTRGHICDAVDQGFFVCSSWDEYDRMVEIADSHINGDGSSLVPFEIIGPDAPDDLEGRAPMPEPIGSAPTPMPPEVSDRTERRRRRERRLAKHVPAAKRPQRTADGTRWVKQCAECGHEFESVRSDATFCKDPACRQRAARRRRKEGSR